MELVSVDLPDCPLQVRLDGRIVAHVRRAARRQWDLDDVCRPPDRAPIVCACLPRIGRLLRWQRERHAQDLVFGVERSGQFADERCEIGLIVFVHILIIDIQARIKLLDREIDQRLNVLAARVRVADHIVHQAAERLGAIKVIDSGQDLVRAGRACLWKLRNTARDAAAIGNRQADWVYFGNQRGRLIGNQALRGQVCADGGRLSLSLDEDDIARDWICIVWNRNCENGECGRRSLQAGFVGRAFDL